METLRIKGEILTLRHRINDFLPIQNFNMKKKFQYEKKISKVFIMNEETIDTFMEVTQCDRRTAMYCLQRNNNNLENALSFFYDSSFTISEDFMNDNQESSSQHISDNSAHSAHSSYSSHSSHTNQENPQSSNPSPSSIPPENPQSSSPVNEDVKPKTDESKTHIYLPYGNNQIEEPFLQEIDLVCLKRNEKMIPTDELYPTLSSHNHNVTIYSNGVEFDQKFFESNTELGQKLLQSISKGIIPEEIFNESPIDQFSLINKKDVPYPNN